MDVHDPGKAQCCGLDRRQMSWHDRVGRSQVCVDRLDANKSSAWTRGVRERMVLNRSYAVKYRAQVGRRASTVGVSPRYAAPMPSSRTIVASPPATDCHVGVHVCFEHARLPVWQHSECTLLIYYVMMSFKLLEVHAVVCLHPGDE